MEDLSFDTSTPAPKETPKQESRSIEDLLKMENASSTSGVNDVQLEEEKKKLELRRKQLEEYKKELQEIKGKGIDDYMDIVSKQLIEKGMIMLDAIQKEIEDNPRGRDVETAAAMMSSINGIVDNLNKQKVYRQKMNLEERKLELKQQSLSSGNINAQQNNTYLIAGSHSDLLEMIRGDKPFPGQELKDADVIKDPMVKSEEDKREV
jgi:vacuolar-type H+-ATPase subunit I/STV1